MRPSRQRMVRGSGNFGTRSFRYRRQKKIDDRLQAISYRFWRRFGPISGRINQAGIKRGNHAYFFKAQASSVCLETSCREGIRQAHAAGRIGTDGLFRVSDALDTNSIKRMGEFGYVVTIRVRLIR